MLNYETQEPSRAYVKATQPGAELVLMPEPSRSLMWSLFSGLFLTALTTVFAAATLFGWINPTWSKVERVRGVIPPGLCLCIAALGVFHSASELWRRWRGVTAARPAISFCTERIGQKLIIRSIAVRRFWYNAWPRWGILVTYEKKFWGRPAKYYPISPDRDHVDQIAADLCRALAVPLKSSGTGVTSAIR